MADPPAPYRSPAGEPVGIRTRDLLIKSFAGRDVVDLRDQATVYPWFDEHRPEAVLSLVSILRQEYARLTNGTETPLIRSWPERE